MLRSVLASVLLFGLAAAQSSCDLCDTKTDDNGNFITLCYCNDAFEVEFSQSNNTCDDQIAIYKCSDLDTGIRQYPLTWLPACSNYGICDEVDPPVPPGQIPNLGPACIPVSGNPPTVVFDPMPDYGYYGPSLPPNATFPECECLQVVYQRGGLGSKSPPPFLIIENGTRFEIPGEECPPPTPSPVDPQTPTGCEETNGCFRACDIDEYDQQFPAPCKRPSAIILKYTGMDCSADDCIADHPFGTGTVSQEADKCECTSGTSTADGAVTVVDKNGNPVPSTGSNVITGMSVGTCFSIGSSTVALVDCDIEVSPGRRLLGMDEIENTPESVLRPRRLKSGGGGGDGDCVYEFESETTMTFGSGQIMRFHTSCSQALAEGMKLGEATIVGMIYEET